MTTPHDKKLIVLPSSLAMLVMGAGAWTAAAEAGQRMRAGLAPRNAVVEGLAPRGAVVEGIAPAAAAARTAAQPAAKAAPKTAIPAQAAEGARSIRTMGGVSPDGRAMRYLQ